MSPFCCEWTTLQLWVTWDSFTTTVSVSPDNLALVCREEYNSSSRASARPPEPTGRRGIQDSERLLWLDAEPVGIPSYKLSDGFARDGSLCIMPDKATPALLQLKARSRSEGDTCLHAELGSISGVCQPSVVADTPLPDQAEKQTAQVVLITPLWKTQPWYPLLLEFLEDLPQRIPHQPDLVVMPQGQEFLMQQGAPQLVVWPISGNPIHHEDFLHRLQTSRLHHGETKLTPTIGPHSLSGLAGVSRGVEIPFQDL